MPSSKKASLVFVHRKKTGEVEIRCASNFIKRPAPSATPFPPHLHYTNASRSHVCHCANPDSHEHSAVSSDSVHFAAAITRFLDLEHLNESSIAQFHAYEAQIKAECEQDGIFVDTFHYATAQKDVVCRCTAPNNHGQGPVRNPDIADLCAAFFYQSKEKMTCTKAQWRTVSNGSVRDGASVRTDPRSSQEVPVYYSGAISTPRQSAATVRPSLHNDRCVSPVASSSTQRRPTATPMTPFVDDARTIRSLRPSTRNPSPRISEATQATSWSRVQREAAGVTSRVTSKSPHLASPVETQPPPSCWVEYIQRADNLPAPSIYSSQFWAPSSIGRTILGSASRQSSAKFSTTEPPRVMTHNSATLRNLEGSRPQSYESRTGTSCSIRIEQFNLHRSQSTQASTSLSSIFQQIHDAVILPDQEEFLLRHIIVCSRSYPAPSGECSVCAAPYSDRSLRTIRLPSCGHYLHESCLLVSFRIADSTIGTCPICDLALCGRSLVDRVETDRDAIFGSQCTKLRSEVRVEFPQRGEIAHLQSEEELAAAQLRLLKDYIDVHAEDLWQRWDVRGAEPDWHVGIIRPVVELLKGWNLPAQHSKFFSDRNAFIQCVAWAELVRLMNVTRTAMRKVEVETANFPPLAELHRKFLWAKDRFDQEKKSWRTNSRGGLDCEKVVQDAYDLTVLTHNNR